MPKYGPHLEAIREKINDRLDQLNLRPGFLFDPRKNNERFYTAPCKDKNGGKVIFKMRTEDYKETKEYFRREIKINRLFTECYGKNAAMSVPRFMEGDSENIPEWMVYEFIKGCECGDFYNGLEKDSMLRFPLESFICGMKNMHEMSAFAQGKIGLGREGYKEFKDAFERYGGRLKPFFSEKDMENAEKILDVSREILDRGSVIITHGDFHPGNVIITDKKEIAIIDWYYVHLNNLAYDIAFFFLEIADDEFGKKMLEKFVDEMVKDEKMFWRLFRADVLCIIPWKVNVLCDALYTFDPAKEDYYRKLTPKGIAKLEKNLDVFEKALAGDKFL